MVDREPDLVIVGYARLFGAELDGAMVAGLRDALGESPDDDWGALFVYDRREDGTRSRWTLMTSDHRYAEMLATAGRIEIDSGIVRKRFPAFQKGWVIADVSTG